MNLLISPPWKSTVCCCFALHMGPWLFLFAPIQYLTWSWIFGPALIFLMKCLQVILVEVSLQDTCVPTRCLVQLGHPSGTAMPWDTHRPKSLTAPSGGPKKPYLYADDNKHIKPLQLIKTWQLSPKGCLQAKGCNDKSPSWFPIKQENFNHLF